MLDNNEFEEDELYYIIIELPNLSSDILECWSISWLTQFFSAGKYSDTEEVVIHWIISQVDDMILYRENVKWSCLITVPNESHCGS